MALGEYQALLFVSFGGPESRDDVIPFLENVLRGRNVPRERMLEVAEHYYHFDGVSPINAQCRELIATLQREFDRQKIDLPIFWGNRNWTPLLPDTLREMSQQGIRRALAYVTAAYSSYSSCRQYRENLIAAQSPLGTDAPAIDKIRVFYNHPLFIKANADRIQTALQQLSGTRDKLSIAFTAHSIPVSMSNGCNYLSQLQETCRLTLEEAGLSKLDWKLVFQSRSGRPEDPWLGPDIGDHLRTLKEQGFEHVLVHPIGFLSDHLEVLFDLDVEAQAISDELELNMIRSGTVGAHPIFVEMIVDLVKERAGMQQEKKSIGNFGPNHDLCPIDCCPAPALRRPQLP